MFLYPPETLSLKETASRFRDRLKSTEHHESDTETLPAYDHTLAFTPTRGAQVHGGTQRMGSCPDSDLLKEEQDHWKFGEECRKTPPSSSVASTYRDIGLAAARQYGGTGSLTSSPSRPASSIELACAADENASFRWPIGSRRPFSVHGQALVAIDEHFMARSFCEQCKRAAGRGEALYAQNQHSSGGSCSACVVWVEPVSAKRGTTNAFRASLPGPSIDEGAQSSITSERKAAAQSALARAEAAFSDRRTAAQQLKQRSRSRSEHILGASKRTFMPQTSRSFFDSACDETRRTLGVAPRNAIEVRRQETARSVEIFREKAMETLNDREKRRQLILKAFRGDQTDSSTLGSLEDDDSSINTNFTSEGKSSETPVAPVVATSR